MDPDTDLRQDLDDALQDVRARRRERESSPGYRRRLRERDELYVRGALRRRDQVRRLRLADGLPAELGGGRPPHPDATREACRATHAHLVALGLWSEASATALRPLWSAS